MLDFPSAPSATLEHAKSLSTGSKKMCSIHKDNLGYVYLGNIFIKPIKRARSVLDNLISNAIVCAQVDSAPGLSDYY
jgi:hypothetical protein